MTDDEEAPWIELARVAGILNREFADFDARRGQMTAILEKARALARDGLWPGPAPVPTFPARVALSMDAAMRELMPADPPAHVVVHAQAATAYATAPSPGIRTSFTASGSTEVEPKRGLFAGLSPGQIMALALIWVIAYVLPFLQMALPADYQTLATNAAAWWGIALAITYAILANRK